MRPNHNLPGVLVGYERMRVPDFWKSHYVTSTDPADVEAGLEIDPFSSAGGRLDLLRFAVSPDAPSILISQGSGGHPFVFAELAYLLHRDGYNVFVMPRHGDRTISQLMARHRDALDHIRRQVNDTVVMYGEGLGGYVAFYLALAGAPLDGLVCENSPAILTEPAYHHALLHDAGPWSRSVRRRRLMLPVLRPLARIAPWIRVPVSSYLPWKDLVDTRPGARDVEMRLVLDGYLQDPDFDRWYSLRAIMSLLGTPPPGPLEGLTTPTLFLLASDGPTPGYIAGLYDRLPAVPRRLVPIDGSVYWMLSHPRQAATLISGWSREIGR